VIKTHHHHLHNVDHAVAANLCHDHVVERLELLLIALVILVNSRIENGKTDIQLSTLYRLMEIGLGKTVNVIVND
jgi:hypothetical protein